MIRGIQLRVYYGIYSGLNRVEVEFANEEEMNEFVKPSWMGAEIINSPLAFDKDLNKLTKNEFKSELTKYINE